MSVYVEAQYKRSYVCVYTEVQNKLYFISVY